MKKLLTLFFTIFLGLLPMQAVMKINANPINVAVVIVEKCDSTNISEFLDYYGYTFQRTDEGYNVMTHPNGSEIRYSFKNTNPSEIHPTVIVTQDANLKETKDILSELKFNKEGDIYQRTISSYNHYITLCEIGAGNKLTFQRIQKRKK